MRTHKEAVELARMCAHNAHLASTAVVARELWQMALKYQREAAALWPILTSALRAER